MNLVPQIEAKLAPFAARPHWAKVFLMNAGQIEALYPRLKDFRTLIQEFDPKGKFSNRYIRDHIDNA
jgi:xylitol oxidase